MFNSKVVDKYEDYLEWFYKRQDELCDYEMKPLNYDEFEDEYMELNKD